MLQNFFFSFTSEINSTTDTVAVRKMANIKYIYYSKYLMGFD